MLGRRQRPLSAWVPDNDGDDSVVLWRAVRPHLPRSHHASPSTFVLNRGGGQGADALGPAMLPGPARDSLVDAYETSDEASREAGVSNDSQGRPSTSSHAPTFRDA